MTISRRNIPKRYSSEGDECPGNGLRGMDSHPRFRNRVGVHFERFFDGQIVSLNAGGKASSGPPTAAPPFATFRWISSMKCESILLGPNAPPP